METVEKTIEVFEKLEELERRIRALEEFISPKNRNDITKKDYKGLAGGIRFLIDNGFFNIPRSVKEIMDDLKREGYQHTNVGVASTLSVTFIKSQKRLTRLKEDNTWKYVIRK